MKRLTIEWWQSLKPEQVGKETEKLVEAVLRDRNNSQTFAWLRFPDAKAARGFLQAQISDYLAVANGTSYFIEVKATRHAYRLTSDRVPQLALLHKFESAGSIGLVLVHHYIESVWRLISVDDLPTGQPSWDLRSHETFTSAEAALASLGMS